MKIVVATSNRGKLAELRELLPEHVELLTSADLGLETPEETGADFVENALIKARAAARSGVPAVADDSGLSVEALGGAPGIFSARFAGELATDELNNIKLIELLSGLRGADRTAKFVSAVAAVAPDGREYCAIGAVHGRIVDDPRGANGFGYDPHFEIDDPDAAPFNGRTMAEISIAEKNRVSHRARAYRNLLKQLEKHDFFGQFAANGSSEKSAAHDVGRR